jgi:hypothetical protein
MHCLLAFHSNKKRILKQTDIRSVGMQQTQSIRIFVFNDVYLKETKAKAKATKNGERKKKKNEQGTDQVNEREQQYQSVSIYAD